MDGGNDSNQTALFRPIHAPEGGTISGSGGDSLELCDSLLEVRPPFLRISE
jgi:hypothetical protein